MLRSPVRVAAVAVGGCAFAVLAAVLVAQVPPKMPAKPGSPERTADVQVTGHIVKPAELPPPELSQLSLPKDFKIEVFAKDLGNARILAVAPSGNVYVTRRDEADVLMLNVGKDGLADGEPVRVAARTGMHGITFHDGKVYLATVHEVFRADVLPDGKFGPLEMLVHDLPDAGQHHTRTVRFGPDGQLYVSVASTCNECVEPNPENATIVRFTPDGKQRSIYAYGLRDVIGWDWHPRTGELWALDHGIDWLGDDEQPEELNRIQEGKHYGWPFFYADNKANPHIDPPAGSEKSDWKKISTPMALGYVAHSSPMQMAFYTAAQFPADCQGDAFACMRGSWNRKPPSGYEVVRIRFNKDGQPTKVEPFVTGFLTEKGQHARPCGLAVAKDGAVLFTDDRNGIIYRVSYHGPDKPGEPLPAPKGKPPEQIRRPLTIAAEGKADTKLTVTSPAFKDGEAIPLKHSGYDQNASIPLKWSDGPTGTKGYVILMEDPDAATREVPVPHWVAWDLPAKQSGLREGVVKNDRLEDPKGMSQGKNYLGRPGYDGPKPPPGDPPHHYHLEVFALDAPLALPIGAKRNDVAAALKGHVLAAGELVGTFARPTDPKKPE